MSQNQTVLTHLLNHRSITRKTAYNVYGIANLPARIGELRKDGHNITTITCQDWSTKQKRMVRFARYRLAGKIGDFQL